MGYIREVNLAFLISSGQTRSSINQALHLMSLLSQFVAFFAGTFRVGGVHSLPFAGLGLGGFPFPQIEEDMCFTSETTRSITEDNVTFVGNVRDAETVA